MIIWSHMRFPFSTSHRKVPAANGGHHSYRFYFIFGICVARIHTD
jgi:hypothetical protein